MGTVSTFALIGFVSALVVAPSARAVAVRCADVFETGRRASTPAEQRLENDYYNAHFFLLGKLGELQTWNPDPRLSRLDVGPISDDIRHSQEIFRPVDIDRAAATRGQWEPLNRFQEYERANRQTMFDDPFFENEYTRPIVAVETKTPHEAPVTRFIPPEYKTKYAPLFRPRHEFAGATKNEQAVDASVRLAFSALQTLIVRGENAGSLPAADLKILKDIFFDGPAMKPVRFAGEREMNFNPDPASPHRLVLTGNEPGSPIVFNRDRLNALVAQGKLTLPDLAGLIVHELAHHRGLKDDAARVPDRLGALVTGLISGSSQSKALDPEGRVKMHLFKWGYGPKVFREVYEWNAFSVIIEDGGRFHNVTPYVIQILKRQLNNRRSSLFTLRDFDVDVIRSDAAGGRGYETRLNFHIEETTFDLARYVRETGMDPTNIGRWTLEQQIAWQEAGGFANPKYQIKQPPKTAEVDILFNVDREANLRLGSLLVNPRYLAPADVSAGAASLGGLKVVKSENGKISATAVLKNFDLPEGFQMNLIARAKDLDELPLAGPINRVPVKIDRMTTTPEGLKLEFTFDDTAGYSSRDFSIDSLHLVGNGMASMIPIGVPMDFKLPPRPSRGTFGVSAMEVKRDASSPEKANLLFQLDGVSHLQAAKLYVEVEKLVGNVRFERYLMEVDLMKLNDPGARDRWQREWLGQFVAVNVGNGRAQYKVDMDLGALEGRARSVRLHSLFVKDLDLRRDLVGIPGQPVIHRDR